MQENIYFVRGMLPQTGGRVTAAIREKCHKTIDLYRDHFSER